MDNLIQNKWFKLTKYLLAGALVLVSVIALLASWYAGHPVTQLTTDHPALVAGDIAQVISQHGWRVANLTLGIIGLLTCVVLLANRNKSAVVVTTFVLAFALLVVLLVTASEGISTTTWVYQA